MPIFVLHLLHEDFTLRYFLQLYEEYDQHSQECEKVSKGKRDPFTKFGVNHAAKNGCD